MTPFVFVFKSALGLLLPSQRCRVLLKVAGDISNLLVKTATLGSAGGWFFEPVSSETRTPCRARVGELKLGMGPGWSQPFRRYAQPGA